MTTELNKSFSSYVKEMAYQDFQDQDMDTEMKRRMGLLPNESIQGLIRPLNKDESPYYDDISSVPSNVKAAASPGSYKMSHKLVHKLINRRLFGNDESIQGASNCCINTVIYFCTICDNKGFIEDFCIKDLIGKTCGSERGAYYVLHKLEEKGFIRVDCYCKNGYRDITVLDNDFSSYKKERYLNLNRQIFNVTDTSQYGFCQFRELSLYAKKLLLLLLYEYDAQRGRTGYHSLQTRLARKLGLKNVKLIEEYAKEILPLCPPSVKAVKAIVSGKIASGNYNPLYFYKSKRADSQEKVLFLEPHAFDTSSELDAGAPSFLKYKVNSIFSRYNIPLVSEYYDTTHYDLLPKEEKEDIVNQITGCLLWNSIRYKDSPITVFDLLHQFERFIVQFLYFDHNLLKVFQAYIVEFARLSRFSILPGHVLS